MVGKSEKKVITDMNVREHFHETVLNATVNQCIDTSEHTIVYIVNLLTTFTHAHELYDNTTNGPQLKPLAHLYGEAVSLSSENDRNRVLKQLGDISLFIAGIFSNSLNKRLVGVDYYIAMGGNAYGYLSDVSRGVEHRQVHSEIFEELSNKFKHFVDVLGEVSEQSNLSSQKDLLSLYDYWMKTASKRAERQLKNREIYPVQNSADHRRH